MGGGLAWLAPFRGSSHLDQHGSTRRPTGFYAINIPELCRDNIVSATSARWSMAFAMYATAGTRRTDCSPQ
jgi:hypothetical protein